MTDDISKSKLRVYLTLRIRSSHGLAGGFLLVHRIGLVRWRQYAGHSKCLVSDDTLERKGVCHGKEVISQEASYASRIQR